MNRARAVIGALVLCLVASTAGAFIVLPTHMTPVERLLANAERDVAANPQSAWSHYHLARVHYSIFSTGLTLRWGGDIAIGGPEDLEHLRRARADELAREDIDELRHDIPAHKRRAFDVALARRLRQLEQAKWTPATSLAPSLMARHAAGAMQGTLRALELEPGNPHFALMRASLAEQFLAWQRQLKVKEVPPVFRGIAEPQIRDFYLQAFRLGYEAAQPKKKCAEFKDVIVHEAGEAVLRLAEKTPGDAATAARNEVLEKRAAMETWPAEDVIQLVSPIVFSLDGSEEIASLLADDVRVDFDLRGWGPRERWSWLRPSTALLVWDPQRAGRITSGQQLFGNYTFQIAWENGYHALAALDDNGDGRLSGAELDGLRAWFDRDGDGRSTPDEVVDLAECGIVSLAVRATECEGVHPMNRHGLTLADGRTLPTWDWMTPPRRD